MSSPPTKVPATSDAALGVAFDRVWSLLADAVADRHAALRQLALVTDGPDARLMVVRGCDRAAATLRFHTDRRAGKAAVLARAPRVAVVGYDAVSAIQLRAHGTAAITGDGPLVDAAWAATPAFARRAYMTIDPPGTALAAPGSGLADAPNVPAARANFAVVVVTLDRIEWLHLAHDGHRRAVHVRGGDVWDGCWLVP